MGSFGSFDLVGFTKQVASFGPFAVLVIYLIGFVLVGSSVVMMLRMKGGSQMHSVGGVLSTALIGTFFLSLPSLLSLLSYSLDAGGAATQAREAIFGGGVVQASSGGPMKDAINFAATVIGVIGLVGFVKGWLMLNHINKGTGGGSQTSGRAWVLILGGLAAINLPWTVSVIAGSMGYSLSSLIVGG